MSTNASLELTKQLAQDLRELRGKVESIDDKMDELRTSLHTHRLTGNGEVVDERAVKLPLGRRALRPEGRLQFAGAAGGAVEVTSIGV